MALRRQGGNDVDRIGYAGNEKRSPSTDTTSPRDKNPRGFVMRAGFNVTGLRIFCRLVRTTCRDTIYEITGSAETDSSASFTSPAAILISS